MGHSKNPQTRRRQRRARKLREQQRRKKEWLYYSDSPADRMCRCKTAYPTQSAALEVAVRTLHLSKSGYFRAYECPRCHQWHITSKAHLP